MGVTSNCSGHALFFVGVMADRLAMLAAVSIIIIRRRRREARLGREWSRDWLKERQSEKGMEEFVVTELAADLGVQGRSPLKLKAFCRWTTQTRVKICHFSLVILNPQVSHKQCLEWIELVNFLINVKRICVTSNINMKSTVEADGVGSGLYKQYGKTIDSRPLQEVH